MYRRDLDLPRLPSFVEKVVSARYGLPNMMLEDADHPARCRYSFVEEIRGNSLNRIPQVQKLRSSFGWHRASNVGKLVHRRAADLALDDRDPRPVNHREFESPPVGVVTYYAAPLERHRMSLNPRLRQIAAMGTEAKSTPRFCREGTGSSKPQASLRSLRHLGTRARLSIRHPATL